MGNFISSIIYLKCSSRSAYGAENVVIIYQDRIVFHFILRAGTLIMYVFYNRSANQICLLTINQYTEVTTDSISFLC